jgi:hypothetical protein
MNLFPLLAKRQSVSSFLKRSRLHCRQAPRAEILEQRRLFAASPAYYWPEDYSADGVTGTWQSDPNAYDQNLSNAVTITGLPAHTAVSIHAAVNVYSPNWPIDSDTVVITSEGHDIVRDSSGWYDNTPVSGDGTFAHMGSSLTVSFEASGFESGEAVCVMDVWVDVHMPQVSIATGGDVAEGGTTTFTVSRDNDAYLIDEDLVVDLSVAGTAEPGSGSDYAGLPDSVTIPAGQGSVAVPVQTFLDGDELETDESIEVEIQPSAAYAFAGPATKKVTAVIQGRNGFYNKGNVGNDTVYWVGGNNTGGKGLRAGTVEKEVKPVIETGTENGVAWARVKAATGAAIIERGYWGVTPGDQGTGAAGSLYPNEHIYITEACAGGLNRHEAGHVHASLVLYNKTAGLAIAEAAYYRANKKYGNPGETEAELKSQLEEAIDWDDRIDRFKTRDSAVNLGDQCEFHTWESTAPNRGGCVNDTVPGPIEIGPVAYDRVIYHRAEEPLNANDVNYTEPDYGTYDPAG